jgi:hypothetical protein
MDDSIQKALEREQHAAIFAAVTGTADEGPDAPPEAAVSFDGGPRESPPPPPPSPSPDALIVALADEARGADVWRRAADIDDDR